MKKQVALFLILTFLVTFAGCKLVESPAVTTDPVVTAPDTETEPIQTQPATSDPFEFESEIDFSDFETAAPTTPEEQETQPAETESPVQPKPTEPVPTEPVPTESEPTEPEETQTPTSAVPSLGEDGYNNQIVRP